MNTILFEDFSSFPLGAFPYDKDHSAMGEYHYYPEEGYKGGWFDPIADFNYRGPSWLVTSPCLDGRHFMEQMRIKPPKDRSAVPCLRKGDVRMGDYKLTVVMRAYRRDEISGIAFRYQTSMMHYGFFLKGNGVEFHRVNKMERTVLASKACEWSTDSFHSLGVLCKGGSFTCFLDGEEVFEVKDEMYSEGCIALSSSMPAAYSNVLVEMTNDEKKAFDERLSRDEKRVMGKRAGFPQMKLSKVIDLKDFGAGREIRFGHLTGTKELFFVIAQHQRRVYKDRYPFISCLTAVSLESGEVLWQKGEPIDDEDVVLLTTDLPFQIYDIDNDGVDEVIVSYDFKIAILDGRTGEVRKEIPTPLNTADPKSVTGLEFGRYAFDRLNVDAIRIVNVTGKDRPSDILVKDRYSRLWVYDGNLEFVWTFSKYNTGHFPYNYDFDGDGKDELFSCYNMVDHDGSLVWSLPIDTDHTDEIVFGRYDNDSEPCLAIVSGWEGFMLVSKEGQILLRDINGHGQRISIGNYCPDREGLQICTTTYWQNNGIIYMHDSKGKEIWHREALCNGNVIAPVNWDGSGQDLVLLNADPFNGGLMDGTGDVVVPFPNDGHPSLCCEVLDSLEGERDGIVVWDRKRLFVYTQDRKLKVGDAVYSPEKYPSYNASNYRGEYSFPKWTKTCGV